MSVDTLRTKRGAWQVQWPGCSLPTCGGKVGGDWGRGSTVAKNIGKL